MLHEATERKRKRGERRRVGVESTAVEGHVTIAMTERERYNPKEEEGCV